jgi:hypothetical protein
MTVSMARRWRVRSASWVGASAGSCFGSCAGNGIARSNIPAAVVIVRMLNSPPPSRLKWVKDLPLRLCRRDHANGQAAAGGTGAVRPLKRRLVQSRLCTVRRHQTSRVQTDERYEPVRIVFVWIEPSRFGILFENHLHSILNRTVPVPTSSQSPSKSSRTNRLLGRCLVRRTIADILETSFCLTSSSSLARSSSASSSRTFLFQRRTRFSFRGRSRRWRRSRPRALGSGRREPLGPASCPQPQSQHDTGREQLRLVRAHTHDSVNENLNMWGDRHTNGIGRRSHGRRRNRLGGNRQSRDRPGGQVPCLEPGQKCFFRPANPSRQGFDYPTGLN